MLGAALAQALFFVLQKPLLSRYSGVEVTCYAMWSGTALALPLLPGLVHDLPHAAAGPMQALLFLGVAPSALGFVAWAYAQARLPVATAVNTLYLVPFLALGIGWAVLGETIHPAALFGGLVALAGVAISRHARLSQTTPPRHAQSQPSGHVARPREVTRPSVRIPGPPDLEARDPELFLPDGDNLR